MRRHSYRRGGDAREPALPSPSSSASTARPAASFSRTRDEPASSSSMSRDSIEHEWSELRQAQEQVKKDRQALDRDKAAHEARVRFELEQLGRDIEEERRRFRRPRNGRDCYGFHPKRTSSSQEEEGDGYVEFWCDEDEYPPYDEYWGMDGGLDVPDYEDDADNEEEGFEGWTSDNDEPGTFTHSAYQSYFQQSPPGYNYCDFDESTQTWAEQAFRYREQLRYSDQKCEETRKAYDAYTEKWKTLSATASLLPYPTTDLASPLLLEPPEISIDVVLSEDQTIELNTTIFFLLAFQLQPNTVLNSAGTPKIKIDPRADLEQVKALQKQMKIERFRWHPDSLVKRRVDGMVKEAESKGVYRAIDGLLKECKVRLEGT